MIILAFLSQNRWSGAEKFIPSVNNYWRASVTGWGGPEEPTVNRGGSCPREVDNLLCEYVSCQLQHCEISTTEVVTSREIREHVGGTLTSLKKGRNDEREGIASIIQRSKASSAPATRGIQAKAKAPSPRNTGRNHKPNHWFSNIHPQTSTWGK